MERTTVQGVALPAVGLGTWRLTGEDCSEAVGTALELGYRHVDTAQAYGNERAVGDAIRRADVARDDLFLATKLELRNRSYDRVIRSVDESLAKLDTDRVELLLIHQPHDRIPTGSTHAETLRAMDHLVEEGKVGHVGVSNFDVDQLHEARRLAESPILTNQVQFHPYWDQQELLTYCRIHDVALTAYSPLAHGAVLGDDVLASVGRRYGKSPAQVAVRWVIQHENVLTVPKATSRDHLAENLDVFDFELSAEEMERIHQPSRLRTLSTLVRSRLGV